MAPKRNRLSDVQRKEIRDWWFTQNPRPHQKAIVTWFFQRYGKNISQSSICDCLSSRYEYLDRMDASVLAASRPTYRMRNSHWPILEDMLLRWQESCSNEGQRVTGDMVLEKAKELYPQIPEYRDKQPPEFSSGWLSRFRERHRLSTPRKSSAAKWKRESTLRNNVPLPTAPEAPPSLLGVNSMLETEPPPMPSSMLLDNMDPQLEQVSLLRPFHRVPMSETPHSSALTSQSSSQLAAVDSGTVDSTEEMLSMRILCHVYKDEDIYCMSETSLLWRKAPLSSLQSAQKQNSTLGFMMCANYTGNDRLPLWIIGNTSRARSLNDLNIEALGGHWCSSKKGPEIDPPLMREWLLKFYDHIGKDRSILLLLDKKVAVHTMGLELAPPPANIRIQWLPPSGSKNNPFQPFDHGIRHGLKTTYRRQWLQYIVKNKRQSTDPFATVGLYHAVHWAINAWLSEITNTSIQKCFSKAIGATKSTVCDGLLESTGPTLGPLYDEMHRIFVKNEQDAREFLSFLDLEDVGDRQQNIPRQRGLAEEEEDNALTPMRIPTVEQALQSVQILMCYKEYQKGTTRDDMKLLEQWKKELLATTRAT
ncbi:hypothetical protein PISL3812_04549 [Talaromyces islandicus]|uniref:HTH CENPB-type domain-containing protein n=1 Tax=Talaromyces islandicus TaxID=28573 RepID=A0A0U1LXV8_TALIS|nr:hypothetical protein PISL3812_04549 [Talaromyces islandicus]